MDSYCHYIFRGLAMFWIMLLAILTLAGLQLPLYTHHGLPHRPVDQLTNWGQGNAPAPRQCPPGTVQMDVDGLYLECLRGTN